MPATNRSYRLTELAARFDLPFSGNGDVLIDGVGTLRGATPSQASFLANPAYRADLPGTRAGVVVLKADDADACPSNVLVADDPYLAYARLATLFDPRPVSAPGVHSSASVDPGARIGENVSIGPGAVIGAGCRVGAGTVIGAGAVMEPDSSLGEACLVHPNVTIGYRVRVGNRVILHAGVVLGADGFGIAFAGDHWEKVPQLGTVIVGDDCEIGANTTVDRGAIDDTVLEEDVRIDNLVQVAHNVHIGAHTAIAAQVGIAGSAKIGRYCMLAGASGVNGHIEIADRVTVSAQSAVMTSITEPGTTWSATLAARPLTAWQRIVARLRKLDELARRVQGLEKQYGLKGNE